MNIRLSLGPGFSSAASSQKLMLYSTIPKQTIAHKTVRNKAWNSLSPATLQYMFSIQTRWVPHGLIQLNKEGSWMLDRLPPRPHRSCYYSRTGHCLVKEYKAWSSWSPAKLHYSFRSTVKWGQSVYNRLNRPESCRSGIQSTATWRTHSPVYRKKVGLALEN